jgi:DNA-binding MarR family transcriptional regulator
VEKGLLGRAGDRADRRRVQLRVRPDARRFTRLSPSTIESVIARVLEQAPAAHVAHTRSVLTTIAAMLEADDAPAARSKRRR